MSNYTLSRKLERMPPMGPGDEYRVKALEFRAMARSENDLGMRAEFENLARAYLRLAEQAERNSQLDLTYEIPINKSDDRRRAEAAPLHPGHEQSERKIARPEGECPA